MKKEMESPNVKKTTRKHVALLKEGKRVFSAIYSLTFRGGEIDTYWLCKWKNAEVPGIEKNSQPRRRYDKRHGLDSSRGILMAHFSDKRSSDLAVWRFNSYRHIFWPYNSFNFGVPNCRFLFVAGTTLSRCGSRQFVLFCSKSLNRYRKQQHFG